MNEPMSAERREVLLNKTSYGTISHGEIAELWSEIDRLTAEVAQLNSFFAETLPFLEEAWTACFHGEEKKLLSAEERGMGRLLSQFRQIAGGKPDLPFGVVSNKECDERVERAMAWANQMLGQPNSLKPELQEWISPGETCADGIERANTEVERLRAENARLKSDIRVLDGTVTREWIGDDAQPPA